MDGLSATAAWELVEAIAPSGTATRGRTRRAEVTRIDPDGAVWARVQGASDETPVQSTAAGLKVGDSVSVEWRGGKLYASGNYTDPSAGTEKVERVERKADTAIEDAQRAHIAADAAELDAARAHEAADAAQSSADTANSAAVAAQGRLSDVENVVGTLNWIAEHGTWTAETSQTLVDGRIYYTRSGSGTSADPYVYEIVPEPVVSDIGSYYYLVVDESVQQYVASHLWLDSYGLNLTVDSASGYRIHEGTVDGNHSAGLYIVYRATSSSPDSIVAQFSTDCARIGAGDSSLFEFDLAGSSTTESMSIALNGGSATKAEQWTVTPDDGSSVRIYVEQVTLGSTTLTSYFDIVVGTWGTTTKVISYGGAEYRISLYYQSSGYMTLETQLHQSGTTTYYTPATFEHAKFTKAIPAPAFTAGLRSGLRGAFSAILGRNLLAESDDQTAIGRYNSNSSTHAFEVGNGTSDSARSNAFAVSWSGDIECTSINGIAITELGTRYHASSSKTISSSDISSMTEGASVTLPAGTYVVVGRWSFNTATASSTARNLECAIGVHDETTHANMTAFQRVYAANGSWATVECTCTVTLSAETKLAVFGSTSGPYSTSAATSIEAVAVVTAADLASAGGGGVTDYDDLSNRPRINSVTLTGNKSLSDIGVAAASHTHGSGGIEMADTDVDAAVAAAWS